MAGWPGTRQVGDTFGAKKAVEVPVCCRILEAKQQLKDVKLGVKDIA